jgi:hypothetical protein
MSDAVRTEITASFVPGGSYDLNVGADVLAIRDSRSLIVAQLPVAIGGLVRARGGEWSISAERRRRGWAVVAREPRSGEIVASASPRWWPSTYGLRLGIEDDYRLRQNQISSTWIVRKGRNRVATFTSGSDEKIEVSEAIVPNPNLTLVLLLAYETIRYDRVIPAVGAASGGGG